MVQSNDKPSGPDLTQGIPSSDLGERSVLTGHARSDAVLLVRSGGKVSAIGAHCTHYHGPLAEGLVVGDTIRCPWHHACFNLKTGEALAAPALSPIDCWQVTERDGRIVVGGKMEQPAAKKTGAASDHFIIVGGGAAGFAAAEMLRRRGFAGSITMLSNDDAAPVDRPNLSKDYLADSAPEDWLPLRGDDWYTINGITLRLKTEVAALDARAKQVTLADNSTIKFDKLLLATGAEPVRLQLPGTGLPHVHTLRALADCRAIIANAEKAKRAVVVGASFIGLETAASLRTRGIEVHVVAPEKRPLERVFGPDLGDFVRTLHEEHGVNFHLENGVTAISAQDVTLKNGGSLAADLVVLGVGVRPRLALAEQAGLATDKGVNVNGYLETSAPGIFAAGDIARWPDPISSARIRVEHWVVAERQGQTAALNMLGERVPFRAVPFFWSQHYDVPINYVGHAEKWDAIEIDGNMIKRDCVVRYIQGGRVLAVASIYRDRDSLKASAAMEAAAASG
ncbi:MAG: FAD-dependent oxidoreductase [Pseudolabrys sp.]|jgi:NADPH-dependent 2,4-dienoyl-CoA reductase/sulfur reductase-like enzyme/nitrite reductase/ring-hydroxylating ferredoxin subunit